MILNCRTRETNKMSGEHVTELPEELREWVENRADESDQTPADVLTQALTAYQLVESEGESLEANGGADASIVFLEDSEAFEDLESLENRLEEVESVEEQLEQLEAIEQRLDAVEADVDEKIDDVRERVIQVKREADSKAPADHDHPQLHQRLERALRAAEEANATSKQLGQRVDRVDQGFENFEEVLEYLTDTAEELEEKLDVLAYTVIDLRESVGELEGTASARAAAADLKSAANREGLSTAKCGGCESKVQIALLSTPHCPHCGTTFREIEPAEGLFGSAYLRTGDQPALQRGESNAPDTPEDLFDEYDTGEGGQ